MWGYESTEGKGHLLTRMNYSLQIKGTPIGTVEVESLAQEITDGMNVIEELRQRVHTDDLPMWLLKLLREKKLTAW